MSSDPLIGRVIWLEMDRDHSAVRLSPRKGVITHVFKESPVKEAVVVELLPPPIGFLLLPRRLKLVVLRYLAKDQETIHRTFEMGSSYAEVSRLKDIHTLQHETVNEQSLSRLGYAIVYPWPKYSIGEVKKRLHSQNVKDFKH